MIRTILLLLLAAGLSQPSLAQRDESEITLAETEAYVPGGEAADALAFFYAQDFFKLYGLPDGTTLVNADALLAGVRDGLEKRSRIEDVSSDDVLFARYALIAEVQARTEALRLRADREWLDAWRGQPNVVEIEPGLLVRVDERGTGPIPTAETLVEMTINIMLPDGTSVGDTSQTPFTARVDGLVDGVRKVLVTLPEGSKAHVFMSSEQAYGDREAAGVPANSALYAYVELIDVK